MRKWIEEHWHQSNEEAKMELSERWYHRSDHWHNLWRSEASSDLLPPPGNSECSREATSPIDCSAIATQVARLDRGRYERWLVLMVSTRRPATRERRCGGGENSEMTPYLIDFAWGDTTCSGFFLIFICVGLNLSNRKSPFGQVSEI